jgi:hypothetical protein
MAANSVTVEVTKDGITYTMTGTSDDPDWFLATLEEIANKVEGIFQ